MIIDAFNHFYPKEYLDSLTKLLPEQVNWISSTMRGINNLEYRVNQMDKFGVDIQILSLPLPTLDDLSNVPVQEFKKITKAANDGIARIAEHSNGRFKGIATVSLLEVGDAIEEVGSGIEGNIAPALPDSIHGAPSILNQ